jgi:hypothetical protein
MAHSGVHRSVDQIGDQVAQDHHGTTHGGGRED